VTPFDGHFFAPPRSAAGAHFAPRAASLAGSSASSTSSSRTLAGADHLMRSVDSSFGGVNVARAHASSSSSAAAAAREHDALCHVARVLVSDAAIQRAILANEELRAMLRVVDLGYPSLPAQVPLGVAPSHVADGDDDAVPPPPPAAQPSRPDLGAELRAAVAAAAHDARTARRAAGDALRRFFADAAERIGTFFAAHGRQRAATAQQQQRVSVSLSPAADDDDDERVRVLLRVCDDADDAATDAQRAGDDAAEAAGAPCSADGGAEARAHYDAHDDSSEGFPSSSFSSALLEAALVLAAAALAVLLLRGRGVSVRTAGAAARAAAAAF
jgi:hypothetical protein